MADLTITVEGKTKSGKSTVVGLISKVLEDHGVIVNISESEYNGRVSEEVQERRLNALIYPERTTVKISTVQGNRTGV